MKLTLQLIVVVQIHSIWTNYYKLSRNLVGAIRTTTINCRVSFIDLYLVFLRNFRIVFLPHTNTVILLEPYCGTITEPGLPVHKLCLKKQDILPTCFSCSLKNYTWSEQNFCEISLLEFVSKRFVLKRQAASAHDENCCVHR